MSQLADTIAERMPVYEHEGTEALDCDDQVRIVRGWLSECGLGNLAVGDAAMRFYAGSALLGGHDMLCAVVDVEGTLNLHFWEASTGRIYPATQPNLGPFWLATRYDLAAATF